MNGDIIFQTSSSGQSSAIQIATKSQYSHMGIIYLEAEKPWVYEAGGTVTLTPLESWTARGMEGHFVIKRLRDLYDITCHNCPCQFGRKSSCEED